MHLAVEPRYNRRTSEDRQNFPKITVPVVRLIIGRRSYIMPIDDIHINDLTKLRECPSWAATITKTITGTHVSLAANVLCITIPCILTDEQRNTIIKNLIALRERYDRGEFSGFKGEVCSVVISKPKLIGNQGASCTQCTSGEIISNPDSGTRGFCNNPDCRKIYNYNNNEWQATSRKVPHNTIHRINGGQ